ncbi:MAG TPA: MliC family protein [Casimicrobiaceae bacterium]|nr:MliC family protein [Casimicrobiaceae bacterium]
MSTQPTRRLLPLAMLLAACVAACEHKATRDEEEAARNTFACKLAGQRLVIRFDADLHEARMLTAAGERVTLQQIPTASGVRYSNGNTELRGKGEDLTLIEFGTATKLEDCQPYSGLKS